MKNRKAQSNVLMPAIIGLLVLAIVVGIAFEVTQGTQESTGDSICKLDATYNEGYDTTIGKCYLTNSTGQFNATDNPTAFNAFSNTTSAYTKFTSFLPIIALVIVAVVVLGYVYLLKRD